MPIPPTPSLEPLIARLKQARRVAIFTHLRPDPDALGSQAAAAHLLKALGAVEIHRMQFAEVSGPYRFLLQDAPGETSMWSSEWAGSAGGLVDTIVLVDTCTYQQLEPAQGFLKAEHGKVVAIDHHLSRDDVGPPSQLYTDTKAAACVEILWQIAHAAGVAIDANLALPLMAGLVGDTGWFRFDSVTPQTHQMASELVAHVDPSELYERLMQNESRPKLGLMQRALASLRWSANDRFAAMLLSATDFAETGANQGQTEYLIDMPMIVGTTEVAAMLTEIPSAGGDQRVRVSLRSKHDVNVNKICNQFSGGGHAKAAGCRIDGTLETAYAKLKAAVETALK